MLPVYIILSVLAIVKGIRSGNPARYFGNPIGVLPQSWQRWIFDEHAQEQKLK